MNKAHKRVLLLAYIAGIENQSQVLEWHELRLSVKINRIRSFLAWLKELEDSNKMIGLGGGKYFASNADYIQRIGRRIGFISECGPAVIGIDPKTIMKFSAPPAWDLESFIPLSETQQKEAKRLLEPIDRVDAMMITRIPTHEPPLARRLDDDRPWKNKRKR